MAAAFPRALMRKIVLRLGALLLGAGVIVFVFNRDASVEKSAGVWPLDSALTNAPMLNWTSAVTRFEQATVVERQESFRAVTRARKAPAAVEKVVVEIVKTSSKYPHTRVETAFKFDAQARGWAPQPAIEYVADQVLAQLKPGAEFTNALAQVEGHVLLTHAVDDATFVLVGLPKPGVDAVPSAIRQLAKFGDVFASVEPHLVRHATRTPNDPYYAEQWALQNMNAPAAWDLHTGSSSTVVAVVDSGIDFGHPDLANRVWSNPYEVAGNFRDDDRNGYVDDFRGYDFMNEDNDAYDDRRHGSLVSGVIGAQGNNAVGMAGICWNVRIMPLKVIDEFGLLYAFDEIRAFDYARSAGAKIINASFGGIYSSGAEYEAISRLRTAGVLLVTAAGNDGWNNDLDPIYPASYPHDNIISVTHSDWNDALLFDSNYGRTSVDLAAPGEEIFTTSPVTPTSRYSIASGSSLAAPHVTGVAALLKAQNPARTYASIRSAILNNVDRVSSMTGLTVTGGRLNAYEPLIPRVPLADALDAPELVWQTGGSRPWFGQTLRSSDGVDAARCGNITDYQTSWIQTTVTGPGVLWFDWRVSSEDEADLLMFAVDGELLDYISGESGWLKVAFTVPSGTHTLWWGYDKDIDTSMGEDKGWIDRVLYLRDTSAPMMTLTSPTSTRLFDTEVLLEGTTWDVTGVETMECRVSNGSGVGFWEPVFTDDNFANWWLPLSNLELGSNTVRLRAVDFLGQARATNITFVVLAPLTVNVVGCGTVPAKFAGTTWQEPGKTLTVRATPCAGHLFAYWSDVDDIIVSSDSALTFVMGPDLTFQANFVANPFTAEAGAYHGLFHEAAGVLHESSGLFRISLTDTGAFTGTLVTDGATNSFSSRFDPVSGLSSFAIPRAGKSTLQVSLQLNFDDTVTGEISSDTWIADLLADRRGFTPANPPPFAGMYTLVFPGADEFTTSPGGHGFATATVDAGGRVSIAGRLGDNAPVAQTIPISKNGDWPFYVPLYTASKGSALGWLKFLSPPGLTNQLISWIRPSLPTAYYPGGFSNELAAIGSPYVVPLGTRVIDCTNALLIFRGADYGAGFTNQVLLTANNTVLNQGPENVTMKIVTTNGTFTGSVIRPARTNTFRGIFLQEQNIGLGYVIGSNYIGEVRFEPAP